MRLLLIITLLTIAIPGRGEQFIAVRADGWVESVPDMLTLSFAVQATGKNVEALQKQVDSTVRQAVEAAREQGVAADDIDSSRLSVRPEYRWNDGARTYLGQSVQREVTLILRQLERYGALVQALSRFEIAELRTPRLAHSEQQELELRAMEHALKNGFTKAKRIAAGIDATLGKVTRVEEQGMQTPAPMARMLAAEAGPGGAPQVQFGKQRISASVNMRFAIE